MKQLLYNYYQWKYKQNNILIESGTLTPEQQQKLALKNIGYIMKMLRYGDKKKRRKKVW